MRKNVYARTCTTSPLHVGVPIDEQLIQRSDADNLSMNHYVRVLYTGKILIVHASSVRDRFQDVRTAYDTARTHTALPIHGGTSDHGEKIFANFSYPVTQTPCPFSLTMFPSLLYSQLNYYCIQRIYID